MEEHVFGVFRNLYLSSGVKRYSALNLMNIKLQSCSFSSCALSSRALLSYLLLSILHSTSVPKRMTSVYSVQRIQPIESLHYIQRRRIPGDYSPGPRPKRALPSLLCFRQKPFHALLGVRIPRQPFLRTINRGGDEAEDKRDPFLERGRVAQGLRGVYADLLA